MLSNFEVMESLKAIKESKSKNKFGRNLATITYEVSVVSENITEMRNWQISLITSIYFYFISADITIS